MRVDDLEDLILKRDSLIRAMDRLADPCTLRYDGKLLGATEIAKAAEITGEIKRLECLIDRSEK
jgi:hypothetical protein